MADATENATEYRLRTPQELAAELRALRDHLRTLDSASPEAALMEGAATYILGATDSLREHMAMIRALRVELAETRGERDGLREVLADVTR